MEPNKGKIGKAMNTGILKRRITKIGDRDPPEGEHNYVCCCKESMVIPSFVKRPFVRER